MRTLEELFERDILRYLDQRSTGKMDRKRIARPEEASIFDLDKDFEKEVVSALAKDDLNQAKKVFDDLKAQYARLKYSDVDKARIFRIMDAIHLKIKTYLISRQKEKNVYDDFSFSQEEMQPALSINQKLDELKATIAAKDMDKARAQAKTLIEMYNNLGTQERTSQVYDQIKAVLVQIT